MNKSIRTNDEDFFFALIRIKGITDVDYFLI